MRYALIITETAIMGGVSDPSSFDIKFFDDREIAITQAASLFTTKLFNLANAKCMPYSSFNTSGDNNCLVEARIFGETEVIVIGVKFVE